jgi:hypothetical protein
MAFTTALTAAASEARLRSGFGGLQLADYPGEAGRVGEGAVDEDDGGLTHGILLPADAHKVTLRAYGLARRGRIPENP